MKNNLNAPIYSKILRLFLAAGLIILAFHPLKWLVNTWVSPDYDSKGFWIFLIAAGLFFWSLTSPRPGRENSQPFA